MNEVSEAFVGVAALLILRFKEFPEPDEEIPCWQAEQEQSSAAN